MVILMFSSQQKKTKSRQVGDAGHQNKDGREKVSIFDEINKEDERRRSWTCHIQLVGWGGTQVLGWWSQEASCH